MNSNRYKGVLSSSAACAAVAMALGLGGPHVALAEEGTVDLERVAAFQAELSVEGEVSDAVSVAVAEGTGEVVAEDIASASEPFDVADDDCVIADNSAVDGSSLGVVDEGSGDDAPDVFGSDSLSAEGDSSLGTEDAGGQDGVPENEAFEKAMANASSRVSDGYVSTVSGWNDAGDGYSDGSGTAYTGYVVDYHTGNGLDRYWIENGWLFRDGVFDSRDGYYGYALSSGSVLRGAYKKEDGLVYLADNDGKLAGGSAGGWVVSAAYGQGLQRYWIDSSTHSAVVGFSSDGWAHYTTAEGYVLRGAAVTPDGARRNADNNGLLQESGWVVTSDFGDGLQRYWFVDYATASSGLYETGSNSWTYVTSSGFVLRGKYDSGDGHVFVANNDGILMSTVDGQSGWVVTSIYDGELQRYWYDADSHAALSGSFYTEGSYHWGVGGQGYVLRGAMTAPYFCFADNDGVILDGWVVSSSFGQGLQRYWQSGGRFVSDQLISETEAGWWAYAESDCRVVRGKYVAADGVVYLADNDGKLENPGWHVTSDYGDGLQRYWVDDETHGCKPGFFSTEDADYYTLSGKGWVLRSSTSIEGRTWYADNDGKIFTPIVAAAAVKKSGDATNIESTVVGDTVYLFLPSYASLSDMPLAALRFSGFSGFYLGDADGSSYTYVSSFDKVDLEATSSQKLSNGALLFNYKVAEASPARRLAVMISSDVTSIFVLSKDRSNEGRDYVEASADHSAKAEVAIVVVASDGTVLYNKDDVSTGKTSTIKGRGNTTWGIGDKKPYQISLSKKADLLQTGNSDNEKKKWVLLANANDVTLLHNTIAYNFALELGLVGTECTAADLWYDGEYRGSYLLCEKIEVNSGRVNIFDLESAFEDSNDGIDLDSLPTSKGTNKYGYEFQYVQGVSNPDDYSGGYLIELDNAWYSSEKCWFKTRFGYFVVKSPEVGSYDAIKYISESLEEAMGWLEGIDNAAYTFDLDSFAKALLVNEYLKNVDYGASSTYFYLDRGEKEFVASPVWDFDGAVGVRNDVALWQGVSYHEYMNASDKWMIENTRVQPEIVNLWYTEFSDLINNVLLGDSGAVGSNGYLHSLNYYLNQIYSSQKMNEVLFGLTNFDNEFEPFATYERNITYLTDWLTWRSEWLQDNLKLLNGNAQGISCIVDGLDYSLVFDASYYKKMNPDVVAVFGDSDEAAFYHFVTYGMSEGRVASRNFNVKVYASQYSDLMQAFGSDYAAYYRHYLKYGFYEGRFA